MPKAACSTLCGADLVMLQMLLVTSRKALKTRSSVQHKGHFLASGVMCESA
jgi:hypothetical protein